MKLLIDCGNTLIKFAALENGQRHAAKTISYNQLANIKEHILLQPDSIYGSIVASNKLKQALEQACEQAWGLPISWCSTKNGSALLQNNYSNTLGTDRWFGMLGLLNQVKDQENWHAGFPYILASFGTATTIDTIRLETKAKGNTKAVFIGGLILPGAELMRQSLAQGTADLPLAYGHIDDFPLDTNTAINSGIAAAQSGALLRQWKKASLMGNNMHPQIYVCGGAWPIVGSHISAELAHAQAQIGFPEHPEQWLDNPVLDGLALVSGYSVKLKHT